MVTLLAAAAVVFGTTQVEALPISPAAPSFDLGPSDARLALRVSDRCFLKYRSCIGGRWYICFKDGRLDDRRTRTCVYYAQHCHRTTGTC